MTAEIILQQSPDELALRDKRTQLTAIRRRLAERDAEMAQKRAQLKAFEVRYFGQVGILYAELDEIEARITEREVHLYDSDAARQRAEEARQRAEESHQAAFGEGDVDAEPVDPPADLKALFRELAKRIHPDLARDQAEQAYLHLLMARANYAYRHGDSETLQQLLDDHREVHMAASGESAAAESLRITRQIGHVARDLARLETEHQALLGSEIAQLFSDAEAAAREHRDLRTELATGLREQIAAAQHRFDTVDRQIRAHGR